MPVWFLQLSAKLIWALLTRVTSAHYVAVSDFLAMMDHSMSKAYLVQSTRLVVVGNNLYRSLGTIRHIQSFR